jgi:hypothetical protein
MRLNHHRFVESRWPEILHFKPPHHEEDTMPRNHFLMRQTHGTQGFRPRAFRPMQIARVIGNTARIRILKINAERPKMRRAHAS